MTETLSVNRDAVPEWAEQYTLCRESDGKRVATVFDKEYATLFSAATGLLTAIEGLFEHCEMVHKHWGDGSNLQESKAAIAAARKAMDKAREEVAHVG